MHSKQEMEVLLDGKAQSVKRPANSEGLINRYRKLVHAFNGTTGMPKPPSENDKNHGRKFNFTCFSHTPGFRCYSLGFEIANLFEPCWQGATLSFLSNGMAPNELKDRKIPPVEILPDIEAFFAGLKTTIEPYDHGLLITPRQPGIAVEIPQISLEDTTGLNLYDIKGMIIRSFLTFESHTANLVPKIRATFAITKSQPRRY